MLGTQREREEQLRKLMNKRGIMEVAARARVRLCLQLRACVRACMRACLCVCARTRVHVQSCVFWSSVRAHVCAYLRVRVRVCACACMRACLCV